MFAHWETIIRPLVDAVRPTVIVEVGSESGEMTQALLEHTTTETTLHSIDPAPVFDGAKMMAEYGERLHLHRSLSLNVLGSLPEVDLVLIDGDHNWFTVHQELRLIERTAVGAGRRPPVVALHDVGWPYGRRDMYYNIETIPPAYRFPAARKGMLPGRGDLVQDSGLNRSLCNAIYEGVERCGVLTAVEDFVRESPGSWRSVTVPGMHGLAILAADQVADASPSVAEFLHRLTTSELLTAQCEQVELQRVEALMQVADLTGALRKAHKERDATLEAAARSRAEAEALTTERDRLSEELAAAMQQTDRARQETVHARQEVDRSRREAQRAQQEAQQHAAHVAAASKDAARSKDERDRLSRELDAAQAYGRTMEERLAVAMEETRYERERSSIEHEEAAHAQHAIERLEALLETRTG